MGFVRKLKAVLGLDAGTESPRKPRTKEVTIESTPAETPDTDTAASESLEQPVMSISGIGPAYADRLRSAGVTSVGELLEADIERLSSETDIAAARIERWVDQASEQ
ncbi:MAG: helix-hairpin-helix domain-containing protein [Natrialbaceae archaeon]|nr:helix-hairpin-helix domain-containing protein [Natrialbaceae archaeon]